MCKKCVIREFFKCLVFVLLIGSSKAYPEQAKWDFSMDQIQNFLSVPKT